MFILSCNIDDMNPEIFSYIMEKLFEEGALDVYRIPILMKKDRMGFILKVISKEEDRKTLKEIIFRETTTIGIREYKVDREKLKREFEAIEIEYGKVNVKKSYFKGELIKVKPEYEDCKNLAREKGVSISKIYDQVCKLIGERFL